MTRINYALSPNMRKALRKLGRVRGWATLDGRSGDALVRRGLADLRLVDFKVSMRRGFGASYTWETATETQYRITAKGRANLILIQL